MEGRPQNLEKKGVVEKKIKNIVSDKTLKNIIHFCDQKTKNLEHPYKY